MNLIAINYNAKLKGILLVALVICFRIWVFFSHTTINTNSSEAGAVFGLFFIFFSNEKIEKDFYPMLRFKALIYAIFFYFIGTTIGSFYLLFLENKKYNIPQFSAYGCLIILLTLAIVVFQYLKAKAKNESASQ